jgi:hypothetical protein
MIKIITHGLVLSIALTSTTFFVNMKIALEKV